MAPETPGYLRPYERAVREHGAAWEAQLWRDPGAQRARFETICGLIGLTPGSGAAPAVADVGCGRADLAAYIAERGLDRGPYVGVEGVPELAAEARSRALAGGWPECSVVDADFVADGGLPARLVSDHGATAVVISGALNTLDQERALAVVARFWDALAGVPGGVFAFNFLCQRRGAPAQVPGDPAVRFDAESVLGWALSSATDVRYRRDYLGALDATVVMRRPA